MTTKVAVALPDTVYERAVRLAQLTNQDVGVVLSETLGLSLPALLENTEPVPAIMELTDAAVLELTTLQLPVDQDSTLSTLLMRQQADTITVEERGQLVGLMEIYQETLLRKAQALAEAVRRGLRAPLTP